MHESRQRLLSLRVQISGTLLPSPGTRFRTSFVVEKENEDLGGFYVISLPPPPNTHTKGQPLLLPQPSWLPDWSSWRCLTLAMPLSPMSVQSARLVSFFEVYPRFTLASWSFRHRHLRLNHHYPGFCASTPTLLPGFTLPSLCAFLHRAASSWGGGRGGADAY